MRLALLAVLLLFAPSLRAQDDPRALLEKALAGAQEASGAQNRFTYHDIRNQATFDSRGRRTAYAVREYDVTWIGDTPYYKLTAEGGHELTGHAREAETGRYLDATALHKKLDLAAQLAAHGDKLLDDGVDIFHAADAANTVRVARTESSPLGPVTVLDVVPPAGAAADAAGHCAWHYTFWLSAAGVLQHVRADAPDAADAGCRVSFAEIWYKQVEERPYAYHRESHLARARNGKLAETVVSEDNMTEFRHFHALGEEPAPETPGPQQ